MPGLDDRVVFLAVDRVGYTAVPALLNTVVALGGQDRETSRPATTTTEDTEDDDAEGATS